MPGTENAKTIEPSEDYIIPLGKGNIVFKASEEAIENGEALCVVTYGMGVHWITQCRKSFADKITLIDLRCLFPLDEELVYAEVMKHGKCLIVTEEQQNNSFAEAFAARISSKCFQNLDAPVAVIGAADVPAIPMNITLEKAVLPSLEKIKSTINSLLKF